jgi:hypothetical protein
MINRKYQNSFLFILDNFFYSSFLMASTIMARFVRNTSLTYELNTFSSFDRHYSVTLIIIMFMSPRFIFKKMSISIHLLHTVARVQAFA